MGNPVSTLLVVDNNSGVATGGLIDDGLPVEVEALIRGKEVDIDHLAIGDEHGSRSQLMSLPPKAEGLTRASRDRGEYPEDPFDLGSGEVKLPGGMAKEVPSDPLPSLPLLGDVAYQLGGVSGCRQRLFDLLLRQSALAIEPDPIRDGVEWETGGGSEGGEGALPLIVQREDEALEGRSVVCTTVLRDQRAWVFDLEVEHPNGEALRAEISL